MPQEDGAKRGRQRERIDRGNQHGDADRDGELAEKLPGDARDEGHRHENGQQDQADGDDRSGDLLHRLERGFGRRQARLLLQDALDVLDHDDGVVDDDADGEHQGEQRHGIGRVPRREQHGEGADQADGNGNGGDDGRAKVAEEQEDDDDHEDEGLAQGPQYLLDGVIHEDGGVVDDTRLEVFRKARAQPGQRPVDGVRRLHRVGVRREEESHAHRRLAVEARFSIFVLGAHLDTRHIADAQPRAVGIGAQHDIAELLRRGQGALRLHVQLELLVAGDGAGADAADRRLHVLRLDGVDDIGGSEVEAGQPLGIEPDPHGIGELAEQQHLADARHARQLVEDVDRGIPRDEQGRELARFAVEVEELQDRR